MNTKYTKEELQAELDRRKLQEMSEEDLREHIRVIEMKEEMNIYRSNMYDINIISEVFNIDLISIINNKNIDFNNIAYISIKYIGIQENIEYDTIELFNTSIKGKKHINKELFIEIHIRSYDNKKYNLGTYSIDMCKFMQSKYAVKIKNMIMRYHIQDKQKIE